MRAVDTNVLVRLITRDDARQATAAESYVTPGGWVGHLVLAETTWVLSAVYGLVSSLGGNVQISSEVGRGTEVSIVLPARKPSLRPPT